MEVNCSKYLYVYRNIIKSVCVILYTFIDIPSSIQQAIGDVRKDDNVFVNKQTHVLEMLADIEITFLKILHF